MYEKNAVAGGWYCSKMKIKATENGLPVAVLCSTKCKKAIENQKFEGYWSKRSLWQFYLKRFFPKLLHSNGFEEYRKIVLQ